MKQEISIGYKELCEQANNEVKTISTGDAISAHTDGRAVLVDIRDVRELKRDGKIPGAFHAPRGMLEFWIDPNSPYHKDVFAGDGPFMFMCAGGMRSLLATKTAQDMGLKPVMNLEGGFGAWKKADGPVEPE
ncbi:MAG: rhodanese-like domain-containing protein [Alphaproteobacteria bacterium]|nr:rhodanese-like domain-containing protein [Alphaproteobacteria bacterium]